MFSKIRHKFTKGNKSNFFHIIPALFVCCKDTKKSNRPFGKLKGRLGKIKRRKKKLKRHFILPAWYFLKINPINREEQKSLRSFL